MKYVISVSATVLMLGSAFGSVSDADILSEESIVEEAESACQCYNGAYVGLGVGLAHMRDKFTQLDSYENEENFKTKDWPRSTTRLIGTALIGIGGVKAGRFYVGGEAMLDIKKNKKTKKSLPEIDNRAGETPGTDEHPDPIEWDKKYQNGEVITPESLVENKGFSVNAGVRLGYVYPKAGVLVYAKFGGAYIDKLKQSAEADVVTYSGGDGAAEEPVEAEASKPVAKSIDGLKATCSKISPIVALGFEKMISQGVSSRVEVQYDFKAKKKMLRRKNGLLLRLMVSKYLH